jgi:alkylation response protein AidB-like acyl-CoA dehydrogenase
VHAEGVAHVPRREPRTAAAARRAARYYADLLTDEVRAGLAEGGEGGEAWGQVVRQVGKDGWLGIGWPTEFGGQGRPATDQFIFFDETRRAGAPFPFVTINTVGPTIMRYGTDEQKAFFLPKILAGELNFAIGYTEPEAGTDLASLRTRAVRDGEEYVVNGAKIFTSGADQADYIWLAVRTDPDVPKHKGISILCVPTTSPGFEWSIINTVGGLTTTQTFYDNVHGAGGQPGGRRERGLAHDHHPAQPRAGGIGRLERAGHLRVRGHRGWAARAADRRRPHAH